MERRIENGGEKVGSVQSSLLLLEVSAWKIHTELNYRITVSNSLLWKVHSHFLIK